MLYRRITTTSTNYFISEYELIFTQQGKKWYFSILSVNISCDAQQGRGWENFGDDGKI